MSAAPGELSSPSVQGGAGPGPSSRAAKHSSRHQRGTHVVVGRHAVAHAAQGIGAAPRAAPGAQAGPSGANQPAATNFAAATAAATGRTTQAARTTAAPAAARRHVDIVDLAGESSDDEVVLVGVKHATRPAPRPLPAKRPRTPAKPPQPAAPPPPPAVPEAPPSPEGYRCPICLDSVDRMATTPCGHVFCEPCLTMAIKARKQCPKCRKTVQLRQIHRIFLTD